MAHLAFHWETIAMALSSPPSETGSLECDRLSEDLQLPELDQEPTSGGLKKVQFNSSASLITDFTPYSAVYGAHPATFEFDAQGNMVRPVPSWMTSRTGLDELLDVDLGNFLECIAPEGAFYRKRPHLSDVGFEDVRSVDEGDQLEVLERRGSWVRDSVGWLPLVEGKTPLFSIRYM
mmetsp:Transcript_46171/g.86496  ORF Transcript_46171/g.86496 Transcript_46171/m.86496 type:complete len:177 (-) Transcript_46171:244-774(-)